MAIEIERKFLVNGEFKQFAAGHEEIMQGYLSSDPERTVRIRVKGDKGYITIKGGSTVNGISRYEWEKEISVPDAKELLTLCQQGIIDKIRYYVPVGKHTFEVDEFRGDNEGLIVAELELEKEDEAYDCPSWLAMEVTADNRYYNASLAKLPFLKW